MYHAKERLLQTDRMQMWYLTFGDGTKPLVMLQGLNTRGIRGAANGLAWMYRKFAKDYKVDFSQSALDAYKPDKIKR